MDSIFVRIAAPHVSRQKNNVAQKLWHVQILQRAIYLSNCLIEKKVKFEQHDVLDEIKNRIWHTLLTKKKNRIRLKETESFPLYKLKLRVYAISPLRRQSVQKEPS